MRSHPADTLVSLGGQRVARAAARYRKVQSAYDANCRTSIASEAEAWKDLVEALTDYGPRHPAKPKPLSDLMSVGE